jgi:hypothetical protein
MGLLVPRGLGAMMMGVGTPPSSDPWNGQRMDGTGTGHGFLQGPPRVSGGGSLMNSWR